MALERLPRDHELVLDFHRERLFKVKMMKLFEKEFEARMESTQNKELRQLYRIANSKNVEQNRLESNSKYIFTTDGEPLKIKEYLKT